MLIKLTPLSYSKNTPLLVYYLAQLAKKNTPLPDCHLQAILLIFCILIGSFKMPYAAEEIPVAPTTTINSSIGLDGNEVVQKQININIELEQFQQLYFGGGQSGGSTNNPLDTLQYYLGLASSPYDRIGFASEYQYWGKKQSLESRYLKSSFTLNRDTWSFTISPQLNVISFFPVNNRKVINLYAQALGMNIDYYGFDDYLLNVNYYKNYFENNPQFLRNADIANINIQRLSQSAQLLISSLEKRNVGVSISRFFSWGALGINMANSRSYFIDNINTIGLNLDIFVNRSLDIHIAYNQQSATRLSDALRTWDAGFSITW